TSTPFGNVIAIDLLGTMTGNINIQKGGVIAATGQGAEGIQLIGTLTGAIVNNGTLQTYGTTSVGSGTTTLPQAGTALGIGASVTGGIYNAGPSTISDTTTVRGVISTAGNAATIVIDPALGIAPPTSNLVIGYYNDPTDSGYSFLNRGDIAGTSINPDVSVTT